MEKFPFSDCDTLVIGSGISGLVYAIQFAQKNPDATVVIITKAPRFEQSTSSRAQGGIAAAVADFDSPNVHADDTLRVGASLCHRDVVELCTTEGPKTIQLLDDWGVRFSQQHDGRGGYELGREGGHSYRRILHVADHTGKSIIQALLEYAKSLKNIHLFANIIAVELITSHSSFPGYEKQKAACVGAYLMNVETEVIFSIRTPAVMLATGGVGKVYRYTSNPDYNSGDGVALAYRRGAKVANMEFIQFHPTCLYHSEAKTVLVSEALRGEGAILKNRAGERFMGRYHPDGELAPRDVVALSIDKELKRTGDEHVFLDISHKGESYVRERFPLNYQNCLRYGINIAKGPVPVVPAAHYCCGGVISDLWGRSSIPGLYVAGEVAHTGLHGANRLASNSLLECLVFANRAAEIASCERKNNLARIKRWPQIPPWDYGFAKPGEEEIIISHLWDEIRAFMWNYVGIVRSNQRLDYASRRVALIKQEIQQTYWNRKPTKNLIELRSLITVAELIVQCALQRKESRGLHQNTDYPYQDDKHFSHDTIC